LLALPLQVTFPFVEFAVMLSEQGPPAGRF
jgi:hypothetical protein